MKRIVLIAGLAALVAGCGPAGQVTEEDVAARPADVRWRFESGPGHTEPTIGVVRDSVTGCEYIVVSLRYDGGTAITPRRGVACGEGDAEK